MLLSDVMRMIEMEPPKWRVKFEKLKGGAWHDDFFPAGNEEPFHSREQAEKMAAAFRARVGYRFRNIRAEEDTPFARYTSDSIVVAYCRVSTDKQDVECCVQKDGMERHIRERLMQPPFNAAWNGQFYVDGNVSSKIDLANRPMGFEATRRLRAGDHFVIWALDRAWRSLQDMTTCLKNWYEQGVFVHVVSQGIDSTTMSGRLNMSCMGFVGEVERLLISARTKEDLANRRKRGKPINQHPGAGFVIRNVGGVKRIEANIDELHLMRLCHHLVVVCGQNCNGVATHFNQIGLKHFAKASKAKYWWQQSVKRAVEGYARILEENGPLLKALADHKASVPEVVELLLANGLGATYDGPLSADRP